MRTRIDNRLGRGRMIVDEPPNFCDGVSINSAFRRARARKKSNERQLSETRSVL
jgi:hypothetical protein